MIGAGPHVSTFCLTCLMPEQWPILCATVLRRATRTDTSSTLDQKRSAFEAKSLRVALKGIESLLLEVELIA